MMPCASSQAVSPFPSLNLKPKSCQFSTFLMGLNGIQIPCSGTRVANALFSRAAYFASAPRNPPLNPKRRNANSAVGFSGVRPRSNAMKSRRVRGCTTVRK